MATENLQIPDIAANQNQKEVTANAATNLLDRALNNKVQKVITVSTALTTAEARENFIVELTGTPGVAFTLDMPDANRRTLAVLNSTDDIVTVRNSAGVGLAQPVIQIGDTVMFHYDGTDFINLKTSVRGEINLNLESLREIVTNDTDTSANHGGILTNDSTPSYARVNGAADKALRVLWVAGNGDEVQFPPVFMPFDLDETQDVTIHLLARMSGATDTPTIDVQVLDGIGDTEMGGATAALGSSLSELTVTIASANISGHPTGFFNIALVPAVHTTDAIELYAAWIEYTQKNA